MKNVSDVYMLTPMQQLMLIHARANPQSDTLFSQFQYTINGPLDREIFKQTWEHIVKRHPALQTIFLWEGLNKPLQVVKKENKLPWVYEDWRSLSTEEQNSSMAVYLKQDKTAGFDLDRNPPIRFGLFQLEDEIYQMVWSSHHLILDRWCVSILADELPRVYASLQQNTSLDLPPARPFKDYVSWIQQQQEDDAKAFWQSELLGFDNDLPLSALRSIDSKDSPPGYVFQKAVFSASLSEKLRNLARNQHLTVSTILQCAWGHLLTHYNNQKDTIIGVTVSGRPAGLPGVEQIVGTFINNLPVRIVNDGSEKLIPWLKKYQKKMSEMQKFDYVSQDTIQKWCHLPYDKPLFDTLFVYQQAISLEQPLTEDVNMIGIPEGAKSNIPITLTIEGSDEGFTSWIGYASTVFSDDAIAQLLDQLQNVLEWFVENTEVDLNKLSLFTEEERQTLENRRNSQAHERLVSSELPTQRIIDPSRTSLESLIADIWADLLDLEAVGIYENFFELGGSSLLAVQLLDRVKEETGVELPISVLFDSPNVSKLAEVVGEGEWKPRWKAMVAVNDVSRQNNLPLFLVPPSATSAIHFSELAKLLESDYPVYSFTPLGLDTDEEPQNRVEDMAALYIQEIRDVQPNGPYQIAGSCFGNLVAYEMAQQLESQGEPTNLIAIDPFYLTQWKPEKRGIAYYLLRIWHFLRSGVLLSEFIMRTKGLFRRKQLEKEDRTKKVLLSHDMARISYVVKPFPGKMSYLQSEENNRLGYHLRWSKLNDGLHESFVIPKTNHANLVSSKNLERVANTITTILGKQTEKQ